MKKNRKEFILLLPQLQLWKK